MNRYYNRWLWCLSSIPLMVISWDAIPGMLGVFLNLAALTLFGFSGADILIHTIDELRR